MHVLGYGAEIRKPSQSIKIGNACIKIEMHVLRYGVNVLRYVMHVLRYGIGCFRHCTTILATVRFFEKIKNFWCPPPARIFYYARG